MLKEDLLKRKETLLKILNLAKVNDEPNFLRCSKKNSGVYNYYCCSKENPRGIYIPKSEMDRAKELAQNDYSKSIIKAASEELKLIDRLINYESKNSLASLYEDMNEGRKRLISPYAVSDETYVKLWLNRQYEKKPFDEDAPVIYTNSGLRVRSKSEKMIAEMLDELGIPYLYEYPVKLVGMGTVYPDFLMLQVKMRENFYYEHLGKMDDPKYVERNLRKIDAYERTGIHVGKNLILSFETAGKPLDTRTLRKTLMDIML